MEVTEVRSLIASLNFRNRKVVEFTMIHFGNTVVLEFEKNEGNDPHKLILEQCVGFSMSYGIQKEVTAVSVIDVNPMLGNLYCTIMFDNERTARIMCREFRVE